MFTGLVQESAPVKHFQKKAADLWLMKVESALPEAATWPMGASIALDGACLTLCARESVGAKHLLSFELSPETLNRTRFSDLKEGDLVHLEPALTVGQSLGGHWVSG